MSKRRAPTLQVPFKAVIRDAQRRNRLLVVEGKLSKKKLDAVRQDAEECGLSFEKYLKLVVASPPMRKIYAINATRQGIHERLATGIIGQALAAIGAQNIEVPPNKGPRSLQIIKRDGVIMLIRGGDLKKSDHRIVKSIDFAFVLGGRLYIMTLKHTDMAGGGQDNQANEARHFLEIAATDIHVAAAGLPSSLPVARVAVLDGDYYVSRLSDTPDLCTNRMERAAQAAREARAGGGMAWATTTPQLLVMLSRLHPDLEIDSTKLPKRTRQRRVASEPEELLDEVRICCSIYPPMQAVLLADLPYCAACGSARDTDLPLAGSDDSGEVERGGLEQRAKTPLSVEQTVHEVSGDRLERTEEGLDTLVEVAALTLW